MTTTAEDVRISPHLRIGLLLCCMSTFLVNMDNTIVNVALTDIKQELHPSISGLQWTVDAYLLVLASLLITSGAIGDKFGRRKVFQIGLTVFAAGSFLCCLAPNTSLLIAFRVLQAIGASMLNPVGMSLISDMFRAPAAKARAFAVWGAVVGIGMASGPLIGGPLVEYFGWRSVFWINIPIALAVAILIPRFVPESKSEIARKLDPVGQLLILAALFSAILLIIEVPNVDIFTSWTVAITLPVVIISCFLFVVLERRAVDPLIELRFFRSMPYALATVVAVATYMSIGGFLFTNTIHLQNSLGFGPAKAGLLTVPMAVMTAVSATYAGRLIALRGYLLPLIIAGTSIIAAAVLSIICAYHYSTVLLLASFVLFGIGFGGANTPVNTIAMSGMPRSRSAVAGAIASTSRQVGQSLGVAIVGSSLVNGIKTHGSSTGFGSASLVPWLILGGTGIVIIVLGVLATTERAKASAVVAMKQLERDA